MDDDTKFAAEAPPAIEAEVDLLTRVFGATKADGSFDSVLYAQNRDALFRAAPSAPPTSNPPPDADAAAAAGAVIADAWAISPAAYMEARARLTKAHEAKRAATDPRNVNHPRWRGKR